MRISPETENSVRLSHRDFDALQHTSHFIHTGVRTALKISDFLSLTQFLNLVLYQEGYRLIGVNRVMASLVSVTPTKGSSINVATHGKDFSERDRLIINLLTPHFEQANRNAELATARRVANAKPLAAYDLTLREAEIAQWMAHGQTNPEVALILQISVRTVEKHMEKILEKLGVENRTTAAVMIAKAGGNGSKASDASENHATFTPRF